ncbi:carbohydrate ABC transporter membrane protein 2 (CUT1 family) [Prauserella shujinwangii]|uniref:Carbohydrate ABC transporter membrane protein 2 (CUT1 family) n=1 Tax=Prauserella shujinwangii TaxID=1453103 RepID=A0A2T0LRQ4_9PSEU|nr:carbohydrate ABC transporter permease [Prauserella shujinwangii]PRX46181.1 carbohydrate ABC transporter membrane protein 2 (CUT1 family) [Prauserella shujinwangii]
MAILANKDVQPLTAAQARHHAATADRRTRLFNRCCTGVLIAFALLWLVPLAWALDTSLKPNGETVNPTWVIENPTLASFQTLLAQGDIINWYAASFIISALSAAGTVVTASLAAYALSRMRFRYRWLTFWIILMGIMVPRQVLVVPQFQELGSINLLNTYWAVILPAIPIAIAVFVFKQFFDGIPKELDEAARIDGAGFFHIYRRIVLPLARPAVSAVTIFSFVWAWNDLLWPLIALSNPEIMTIPVGLATVQGTYGIRYADTMASAILGALPLVLVFLLFQRRIVEGIAGTGLKG